MWEFIKRVPASVRRISIEEERGVMETKNEVQEMGAGGGGFNRGRRRAMRKIAVGVGALAGLSVLPEQWTRPLIGRIVIPAHAATSGEVDEQEPTPQPQGCGLAAGCYLMTSGPFTGDYIAWPGGSGPHSAVDFYGNGECGGEPLTTFGTDIVIAASLSEAEGQLGELPGFSVGTFMSIEPPLPSGCSFYTHIAN
jgi:hypothetical protein